MDKIGYQSEKFEHLQHLLNAYGDIFVCVLEHLLGLIRDQSARLNNAKMGFSSFF